MDRERHQAEQIISKLREAKMFLAKEFNIYKKGQVSLLTILESFQKLTHFASR
jgi:hypothetical protein